MRNISVRIPGAAALFLAATLSAMADGGSGYSRYGVGDLRYFADGPSMGMGGAHIAVLSPSLIDRLNPAAWTRITRTRFSLGTLYEGFSSTDDFASSYLSKLTFNGAAIAIPVATGSGVVVSMGVTPYSRINYDVTVPSTLASASFNTEYVGDGGISLGYLGSSVTLSDELHLGGRLNYYFGSLNYRTKQRFADGQYASAEVLRSSTLRGVGFTFGAIYSGLGHLLRLPETSSLNAGLVFTTTSYLTSTDERFYAYNTSALLTRDTVAVADGTVRIPFSIGGGLSYSTERLLLAVDVNYQNWSKFTDATGAEIRDSYRLGAGGELIPKRESSAPFTQRVAYRFGGYYDASYYRLRSEPVNEIGITGGFGVPVVGDTRLNISAEYGFRGTTDKQLQKDKILRISLTLSGSELWFIRPEQE